MKKQCPSQCAESPPASVTYVVVVHGIGEQRENETVIKVVNRFAEARRCARANDSRDVLTLGQATKQTGISNVHTTEQPWMEFEGIPADPNSSPTKIFLGEESSTGKNLRFVDLCWADILRDSFKHVGQDTEVWAKGLLGRLLRKHEDADGNNCAQVPFWIRRVLCLLVDTLLLVRFAMNFRFKEMKELVFVKYLGDVQVYGEYDRCRGLAVRRFHETMAKIEAEHNRREQGREVPRKAQYVIIAHSLGSVMSFDAVLYAHMLQNIRCGRDPDWVLPGYEREGDFAFLKTDWIQRVESFVTLGSPIDKYLTIWWLNYRYLLKSGCCCRPTDSPRISHFNYCDELDPVGHNLDVAHKTPAYKAVFKCCEDIVFNRYAVPGAAHNKYWTDQALFGWILDKAVDKDCVKVAHSRPRWFNGWVYCKLLFWLYCAVPLLVLLGTYASLSLAIQAHDWRTAAIAAGVFSFLAYFGCRLIDLGIWWRQIQRQESEPSWNKDDPGNFRCWAAWVFRIVVVVVPVAWAAVAAAALRALDLSTLQCVLALIEGSASRLILVVAVSLLVALCLFFLFRLPTAYRVPTVDGGSMCPTSAAGLLVLVCVAVGALVGHHLAQVLSDLPAGCDGYLGQAAIFSVLASIIYAYRLYRFIVVKIMLLRQKPQEFVYSNYASHPNGSQRTDCSCSS